MDTNKSRAKAKAAKKGDVKKKPEVIDKIDFNLEMMRARLRLEIIDKAKHLDACAQELKAMHKECSDKMTELHKAQDEKRRELELLKTAALNNFGIVFLKPERYEQYLH